jgi:flagellar hook-basal body complex protein FliE
MLMLEGLSSVGAADPTGALTGVARSGGQAPVVAEGTTFEQAIGQAMGSAVDALRSGEALAIQGVEGAAPPMKVVSGVMEAQRSLQSVLAVRDKLVSAWQDISKMAI